MVGVSFFNVALILIVGIVAGFLNVAAGGGSMLMLPLLVFLGMDMSVANATNRVGIFMQNLVASGKFHKEGVLRPKEALFFIIPAALGAVAGTFLAIELNEIFLRIVISILICIMAVLLVIKPKMWEGTGVRRGSPWLLRIIFFFIGVYGGFVQAGVGFFFIWAFVGLTGYDLLHSNAIKVTVILCYTAISLLLFASRGLVHLQTGLIIACGTMIGGFLGARFSIAKGNNWLRWVLATVIFASAAKMIFDVVHML